MLWSDTAKPYKNEHHENHQVKTNVFEMSFSKWLFVLQIDQNVGGRIDPYKPGVPLLGPRQAA